MEFFNRDINLLSANIGSVYLDDYNKKLYNSYRKRDEENEILFYSSFPKTIISENLKLGLARQSGIIQTTKRRNISEVARIPHKWVLFNKKNKEVQAVTSTQLNNNPDIRNSILSIVKEVDEQKNRQLLEENPETKKLIKIKTSLSQVINKPNFLNVYYNSEIKGAGIKAINISEDLILLKRDDATEILGLKPKILDEPEQTTPIIEEMDEDPIAEKESEQTETQIMTVSNE